MDKTEVGFDRDFFMGTLKKIYDNRANSMTDIQKEMFNAVWKNLNRSVDIPQKEHGEIDLHKLHMRHAMQCNLGVFSAFKVHRMQNDMVALLLDSNGNLKPFKQWSEDVMPIASHQCGNWLKTEYNTAVLRAEQATRWQTFIRDKDALPNLEWVPSTSIHPGADHQVFWNVIRPVTDDFWNHHRPGDRWNCHCDLRQTTKKPTPIPKSSGYDPHDGLRANPTTGKIFDETHPYIQNAFEGADDAVKKLIVQEYEQGHFDVDEVEPNLTISHMADWNEIEANIRAAHAIINSFPDTHIFIRPDFRAFLKDVKNPEYRIDGIIADRKGIMSEKGVADAFKKAIKQGCRCVVIDLDSYTSKVNINRLATRLYWRSSDFEGGVVDKCYIIHHAKAVVLDRTLVGSKEVIIEVLKKLE